MDPLTVAAGVAAVSGIGSAWRMRRRAVRAEAQAASLSSELEAERHAASHDPLTGLLNRRAFYQLGAALVADPTRHPLIAVALDLDDFKQVNDRFGHAAGDQVLITAAQRFATYAGDDLVARLGGDEFAGLLTSPTLDGRAVRHAIGRLADALAAPMRVAGHSLTVTASIGLVPVDGCTHLAEVLRHADAAMYRAKISGRRVCLTPIPDEDLRRHPASHRQPVPSTAPHDRVARPAPQPDRRLPAPQLVDTTPAPRQKADYHASSYHRS
jgi:diguanylate cyclase (GGDEF)-like protein